MKNNNMKANNCQYSCNQCLNTVGYVGLIGNLMLAVLKITVGLMFFSTALLADALYSVLDIGYSVLIIVGLKISSKPPDENHDFGHGKVEFVITTVFSVLTIIGAIVLFVFALFELHEGVLGRFSSYILLTAFISTIANYLFYKFSSCLGKQFFSPSITSLSIHSKADAFSSVLVMISMGFSYFDYHAMGPFVAIVETAHLLLIGSEIFKTSYYGLLDAAISPGEIKKIKKILIGIDGIININYLKTRKIGQKIWLNAEVQVPSSINVAEVDIIKNSVDAAVGYEIKNLGKIMLNIRPKRVSKTTTSVNDVKLVSEGLDENLVNP